VPSFRVDNMPYGGVKDSGLGREGVRWAYWALLVPVTLAAYPLVALVCRQGLGLRRRPAVEGFGRGARA